MTITQLSPCPLCESDAMETLIHGEYLAECSNPDCNGPDSEDCPATLTRAASQAQWEFIVARSGVNHD